MRTFEEEKLLNVPTEPVFSVGWTEIVTVVRMTVLGTGIGILFVFLKRSLGMNTI